MPKGLNHRLLALLFKEFNQIRRDRRLAFSLVFPPTFQLLLLGFALSAAVSKIDLGVTDDSRSDKSRELVAMLRESGSFEVIAYYQSAEELSDAISRGTIDAGMAVPADFARDLQRGRVTTIQFLLNAMDANTAAIARGYAEGVIQFYNRNLRAAGISAASYQTATVQQSGRGQVSLQPAFLYNPGLRDSWFIVTGVLGMLLMLNSSLVAAGAMVREREAGTIEQLLMSPATTAEIIIAKIAPLFVLLFLMSLLAMAVLKIAFGVPFRGNFLVVLAGAALCILSGISIGTFNATLSKSTQQAQMTNFFINPPLVALSGALNPVEAMPEWMQPLTAINPVHHFATIVRATLLKGSDFVHVWPNFAALSLFTLALVVLSIWRFRKQLS